MGENYTLKDSLPVQDMIKTLGFSKDHSFLAHGGFFNVFIYQYNGKNYEELQKFEFTDETDLRQAVFTDDNQFLAILNRLNRQVNLYKYNGQKYEPLKNNSTIKG